MTGNTLEQRARELLAAECQKPTSYDEPHIATRHAHAAIEAALRLSTGAGWQPIETAPKDNKRPLYLARFNPDTGELEGIDWDGAWEAESESWEIPQIYYVWKSAHSYVEEPTHWAYQDAPLPPTAQAQPCDMGALCIGCSPRNADGSCPDAAQVQQETVDRDVWAAALELPEGYEVAEFLPGIWQYEWDRHDSERMVSGAAWNHPALAAIAAWQAAYDATHPAAGDKVRELVNGLTNALAMHDQGRTTLIGLSGAVHDFLRGYAALAQPQSVEVSGG